MLTDRDLSKQRGLTLDYLRHERSTWQRLFDRADSSDVLLRQRGIPLGDCQRAELRSIKGEARANIATLHAAVTLVEKTNV